MLSLSHFLFAVLFSFNIFAEDISENLNKKFKEAMCLWNRLEKGPSRYCPKNLGSNCSTEIDLADLQFTNNTSPPPELLCRQGDALGFQWEDTQQLLYVIEKRESNSWLYVDTVYCSRYVLDNLKSNTSYQIRIWGVTEDYKINGPSLSLPLFTRNDNLLPEAVSSVQLDNLTLHDSSYQTTLRWTPGNDSSCFYEVAIFETDGVNYRTIEIRHPENLFQVPINNLENEQGYNICIEAKSSDWNHQSSKRCVNVATPSCVETFKNLQNCAPPPPEILNVTAVLDKFGDSIKDVYYNVTITWKKPTLIPDNYNVTITWGKSTPDDYNVGVDEIRSLTVPGEETKAEFYIPFEYGEVLVFVRANSPGGSNVAESDVNMVLPDFTGTSWEIPIYGIGISILVVVLIGCTIYRCYPKITDKKKESVSPAEVYVHRKSSSPEIFSKPITKLIEYTDEWELDYNDLSVAEVLGEGAFGIVRKGYLRRKSNIIPVAIKMLKDEPNPSQLKEFNQEIEIMKSVGSHPNLVSLLGTCSWKGKCRPCLVVEYCAKGDLQTYLRSIWRKLNNQDTNKLRYTNVPLHNEQVSNKLYEMQDDVNGFILKPLDLLSFARQIALGMVHLSNLRVLHRDLAARNVLVCEDNTVKVADFGLSRDVYQDNVYCKSDGGKLPLKWMAIESLTHQQYTTQSDVWSYGILLWEIVTLGGCPYPDVATQDLLKYLESGNRMGRPKNCSIELYRLMCSCWEKNPKDRPTFTETVKYLDSLLESEIQYIRIENE